MTRGFLGGRKVILYPESLCAGFQNIIIASILFTSDIKKGTKIVFMLLCAIIKF